MNDTYKKDREFHQIAEIADDHLKSVGRSATGESEATLALRLIRRMAKLCIATELQPVPADECLDVTEETLSKWEEECACCGELSIDYRSMLTFISTIRRLRAPTLKTADGVEIRDGMKLYSRRCPHLTFTYRRPDPDEMSVKYGWLVFPSSCYSTQAAASAAGKQV